MKRLKTFTEYLGTGAAPINESQNTGSDPLALTPAGVREIQGALVQKGYPLPKYGIDGVIGRETRGQIKKFQRDNGLAETGTADPKTVELLIDRTGSTGGAYATDNRYLASAGESSIIHNYTGAAAKNISLIEATAKKHGITNPIAIIGLLSVIGKESGFIPKSEYSYRNTGLSRLRHVFGKKLKHLSDQEVLELRKDDVAFYDVIYGHIAVRNGYHTWNNKPNDPVKPGDGFKYRGRGFNQVTFKQSYKKYAKLTGIDIVNDPDKLNDVNVAAEVAVLFNLNRLKEKNIDPNSFKTVDEAVQTCARANAGWGKDASRAIASARRIESRLDIKTNLA